MIRKESARFRSYVQWYPFSKLTKASWDLLESEHYYERYIKDGSFVLFKHMRFTTKGYIQKQGATMRDSRLVSPVIYLYLLAVGIEYEKIFVDVRPSMVCLYAGDIEKRQAHYRKNYKVYRDSVTYCSELYDYCIKTDVSNFYGSINVDSLISTMQDCSDGRLPASDCLFLRALLLYCGSGRFPIIENHATLSFLATGVYLSSIDLQLSERLEEMAGIKSFELVRYVDDMYVFFDLADGSNLLNAQHAVANAYSDLLRSKGLSLNQNKLAFMTGPEARSTVATVSFVDFSGEGIDSETQFDSSQIVNAITSITTSIDSGAYSHDVFLGAMAEGFSSDESTIEPMAAFRQCLFSRPKLFQDAEVICALNAALSSGNVALSYNTAAMVQCVLHTRDESLIKRLLNNLFVSARSGVWRSLDSLVALTYLRMRSMVNPDLIRYLKKIEPGLAQYCTDYCKKDFAAPASSDSECKVAAILRDDAKSKVQYLFALFHGVSGNELESAAFIRAFFDRFASHVRSRIQGKHHTWLYRVKDLKKVYQQIDHAEETIESAERMRQSNPLVHASSEMIDNPSFKEDLELMKESLGLVINDYLETIELEDVEQRVEEYLNRYH